MSPAGRGALLFLCLSAVAGVGLHLVGDVDPLDQMLSDSVGSPLGRVLLAIASCSLAAAGAGLAVGLRGGPLLTGLLTLWCLALLAVAFFPTNLPGSPPTPAAAVHRCGAALVAVLPPVFGLLVAALHRIRPLRMVSLAAVGACVVFAALHGPAVVLGAQPLPFSGLAERVLLVLVLAVVALSVEVIPHARTAVVVEDQ